MSNLTPKQKAFADYYIESGNAEQSAINAGYSKSYARARSHEMLANVGIKAYIEERMKEIESKRIMTAKEALELLTSIARGETLDSVVVSGGWGYEVIEKPPDINQRKDAAKEILKRYPTNKQDELKEMLLEAQIRKINVDIEKTQAEIDNMNDDEEDDTINIVITRKEDRG